MKDQTDAQVEEETQLDEQVGDQTDEQIEEETQLGEQIEEGLIEQKSKDEQAVQNQATQSKVEENIITQNSQDAISNFKLAENLISELYEKVFSKSPNFKPTKNQTIGDLLIYLGYRAKSVGVYEKFKKVFKVVLNEDAVRSSENYIPSAIKLAVYVDKKQDECYTKTIVSYLLKTVLYLFDDINDDNVVSLTVNSMGAIYSYLIDNNINVN